MKKTIPYIAFGALFLALVLKHPFISNGEVMPENMARLDESTYGLVLGVSNSSRLPQTSTSFDVTTDVVVSEVDYETQRFDTDEYFMGEEVVVQQGLIGTLTQTFKVYRWDGVEVDRKVVGSEKQDPITKRVAVGTKRSYKTLDTPSGPITYYLSYNMWATSYDGNCKGCTGKTYTGTLVTHGVCAVDPRVIPLYQKVYIPGYGICTALDIGSAIKGNKIDVGFEDVKSGWWSSRWTQVYIIED